MIATGVQYLRVVKVNVAEKMKAEKTQHIISDSEPYIMQRRQSYTLRGIIY